MFDMTETIRNNCCNRHQEQSQEDLLRF